MRLQTFRGESGNGKRREWRELCEDVLQETSKERFNDLLEELLEVLEKRAEEDRAGRGLRRV